MALDFDSFQVLSFDCYGTIIDWESGIQRTLRPVLASRSVDLSDDEILEFYADAEAEIEAGPYQPYALVLRSVLLKFADGFAFTPSERELEDFSQSVREWPPFPDSAAALSALQKKFRLVILSNIDDELFEFSRAKLGLDFYKVFTAQQIGSYKPAIRNFEFALRELALPRERILHVAQSLFHDIAPARQLGLATVWVNRRRGQEGSGATPPAQAEPDLEIPDLKTLASLAV